MITGRNTDKLAAVQSEIEAAGGSCETHAFDIREEAQVKEAIDKIVARNGRIHGLFNNAGGQFPAAAAAMSAKGFDVVVRNNLTGGFIVSRAVFTQSMEKHGGSIVNMAADMRNGFPNMAHTGAARADALEVGAELDILKRFVEYQPSAFGRSGGAYQFTVDRFPVGRAEHVPASERAALECPVGDERASRTSQRNN